LNVQRAGSLSQAPARFSRRRIAPAPLDFSLKRDFDVDSQSIVIVKVAGNRTAKFAHDIRVDQLRAETGARAAQAVGPRAG
jgi:hypothetical protein